MADNNDKCPLVCDIGTGMMKVGFAGEDAPRAIFSTGVRVGIGEDDAISLKYPIEHGIVKDWDGMEKIWHRTFYDELHVDPKQHPVLLTEPPLNPNDGRVKMAELMFETFNVPGIYIALQAGLSMFAGGRMTGIVLHSGDGVSYAVPYQLGAYLKDLITRVDVAGGDITNYMMTTLKERGYDHDHHITERETVRKIKEKFAYVAFNCEQELERSSSATKKYLLPDGQALTTKTERFCGPEILFQPSLIGKKDLLGIHQMAYSTIKKCCSEIFDVEVCGKLFNNIVLTGGSTMLPGFVDRMEKEINNLDKREKKCALTNLRKRIIATPERRWSAWIGGSMVASLKVFPKIYLSKSEYEEHGKSILLKKFF